MDAGGVYGGGKAGAAFDLISFAQRPHVILKACCLFFSIIVLGCISGKGSRADVNGKDHCLYNDDPNACSFGSGIGLLGFLASIGFLVGEYLFEQMSSVKTRKHFVLGDLGFSGFWAFLYFITFCWLSNAWRKSSSPVDDYGTSSANAAIFFAFLSIFTWAGSTWYAFRRFKLGTEAAFAPSYEADQVGSAGYTSYPEANESAYQDQSYPQQQRSMEYQAPSY